MPRFAHAEWLSKARRTGRGSGAPPSPSGAPSESLCHCGIIVRGSYCIQLVRRTTGRVGWGNGGVPALVNPSVLALGVRSTACRNDVRCGAVVRCHETSNRRAVLTKSYRARDMCTMTTFPSNVTLICFCKPFYRLLFAGVRMAYYN
jgi:hypothetical protein